MICPNDGSADIGPDGISRGNQIVTNILLRLPLPPWILTSSYRDSRYRSRVALRPNYLTECTLVTAK